MLLALYMLILVALRLFVPTMNSKCSICIVVMKKLHCLAYGD